MEDRTTARIVGILFIVASVAAVVGGSLLLPTVGDDYLAKVPDSEGRIAVGALLEVVLAMAVIGIAVMLFPVLKRRNEGLALGFVGARTLEAVLILGGTVSALSILTLSQDHGQTAGGIEPLGDTLIAVREWSYLLGPMFMFSVSAVILYTLLYRAALVPAWLSIWGLVGGALLLARATVEVFGQNVPVGIQALLTAPIGLNEMVLAVWLIAKGFNNSQPAVSR